MSGPLRRAGRGRLADGVLLTWSVAEGSRGRRWRSTTTRDGILEMAALLEVDLDSRPTRLELAANGGLLTLHPSGDDTELHGNVVRRDGIDHLAFPWGPDHELWIDGLPLPFVAAAPRLATTAEVGAKTDRPAVRIDDRLYVHASTVLIERVQAGRWRITAGEAAAVEVEVDPEGCPGDLADAASWPLELD